MDGKWETVIDRKKSRTGTKPQQLQQNSTAGSNGVFAAIDDWKPSGKGAAYYDDDDADGPSAGSQQRESDASAATHANGHVDAAKAPPKPKQPKPKPPKRSTPMQAAQALDAAKLRKVLQDVRQKYANSEKSQLETVADWLLAAFQESELQFLNILHDQPMDKSAETPADVVPEGVAAQLGDFFREKSAPAVAAFAGDLVDAIFQGIPESANSKEVPAKTKVGLVVTTALVLRSVPESLLPLAPSLLSRGRNLTGSGRLPLLLWVLLQATRRAPSGGKAAVGVSMWMRVLLPQVLGPESGAFPSDGDDVLDGAAISRLSNSGAAAALDMLDIAMAPGGGLIRDASVGLSMPGASGVEPVMPPAMLSAIMRAVHSPQAGASQAVAKRLAQRLPPLQTLALSGAGEGGFDTGEMLRLSLDLAGVTNADTDVGYEQLKDAAAAVVHLLEADDQGFQTWPSRHKAYLRGSSKILEALSIGAPKSLEDLAVVPAKRRALLTMLPAIRQRHRFHLQSGKGWQGNAARKAEESCVIMETMLQRAEEKSGGGGRWLMMGSMGAMAVASVVAASTEGGLLGLLTHPRLLGAAEAARRSPIGTVIEGAIDAAVDATRPYVHEAVVMARPQLEAAATRAAPAVRYVRLVADPLIAQGAEVVEPLVREATRAYMGAFDGLVKVLDPYVQQAAGLFGVAVVNATAAS